jgi:bifunctional non-homologous end joining protein LigD
LAKSAAKTDDAEKIVVNGHEVHISSPYKSYFSKSVQLIKLDIVKYFVACGSTSNFRIKLKTSIEGNSKRLF